MSKSTHKSNEKFVGANCVRPHFGGKTKKENAITLIALIITIIVMLILTGVTLSITLGDNGLVNKAKEATEATEIAMEKELLLSAVVGAIGTDGKVDYTVLNANLPEGFSGTNGTYTSSNGNTFAVSLNGEIILEEGNNLGDGNDSDEENPTIDILERYLLGEAKTGRDMTEILDFETMTFINMPEEIEENGGLIMLEEMTFVASEVATIEDEEENEVELRGLRTDFYLKYDGELYKSRMLMAGYGEKIETVPDIGVKAISYDVNSNVGKYVQYDNKNWVVLYDDNTNGLQMICMEALLDNGNRITLGAGDTSFTESEVTEIDGVDGKSALEKALYSYDNAIVTLNEKCDSLVAKTSGIVKGVRSVGSNPLNPNTDNSKPFIASKNTIPDYGTLTWFEDQLNLQKNDDGNRIYYTIKGTDTEYVVKDTGTNHIEDFDRMVLLEIFSVENQQEYWLAHRLVDTSDGGSGNVAFTVETIDADGYVSYGSIWHINSERVKASDSESFPVRPVIILEPGVLDSVSGEGTSTSPYILD